METLDTILGYANRQVVLTLVAELPVLLDTSPRFVQLSGFSRHYAIEHEGLRTELYFP